MMRLAACLLVLILSGCPPLVVPVYTHQDMEISRYPTVLYTRGLPTMRLYGVHFGTPEEELKGIRERNEEGWVILRNGARYQIANGKVVGIGVWDQQILSQLEIHSPQDIELKFGKPEKVEDFGKVQIYRFRDGHVHVLWSNFEKRVIAVNILS